MVAIMGSSGSGKTTLLNCLAIRNMKGFIKTGSIKFNGLKQDHQMKSMIGFAQQDDILVPTFTVEEQITFSAKLSLNNGHGIKQRIKELLTKVRLILIKF